MEKVSGIGGLFFRARDPVALGLWYRDRLGVTLVPSNNEELPWRQEAGPTVFAPFPETTTYFGDAGKVWMINFRVRNLDAIVAQLRAAGISVELDPQHYPNGRFARLNDPEGNPIELWEPEAETRLAKPDPPPSFIVFAGHPPNHHWSGIQPVPPYGFALKTLTRADFRRSQWF
jgi:glyoxylase I family protein